MTVNHPGGEVILEELLPYTSYEVTLMAVCVRNKKSSMSSLGAMRTQESGEHKSMMVIVCGRGRGAGGLDS